MPNKTVDKALTDVQVVDAAWRLIRMTNVKEALPPRHSLSDIWRASKHVQDLGFKFLDQYGSRLQKLDKTAFKELESWKDSPL